MGFTPEPDAPLRVRELLDKYNLRPRKGLGQHFLADPNILRKIVEAAELSSEMAVLEIGPGLGTLTRLLARAAGRVVAVELDQAMIGLLQEELAYLPNLELVQGDILQLDPAALMRGLKPPSLPRPTRQPALPAPCRDDAPVGGSEVAPASPGPVSVPPVPAPQVQAGRGGPGGRQSPNLPWPTRQGRQSPLTYIVVANLPYYITSAAIRHLLEADPPPQRLVLAVQREVAERMVAMPGEMSMLAVSVQFYGRPRIVAKIPAGAFVPPPKVDSAVVRIDTYDSTPVQAPGTETFFRVARAGFGQKRKQLKNALAAGLGLPSAEVVAALTRAGVDPRRRAQTLSLDEWASLVRELSAGEVG
jgi:16S rRNA (adenine1518-N6/adenine1519-N6)-dimethyltransferase